MKGEEPWPDLVIATEANNQIDVLSVDSVDQNTSTYIPDFQRA